ncbi:MAG: MFS transporter, partial [Myxococcales bacterium]|nr:MFS transporter [Myxococcales bacterium]
MKSILPVLSPVLGTSIVLIGAGLLNAYTSYRFGLEGISSIRAGLILSGYYAGLVMGSLRCGQIVTNVGHIRAFAGFSAIAAASTLGHSVTSVYEIWFLLRMACGFSLAGIFVVAESWLNGTATPTNRGQLLAVYMVANQVGLVIGQAALAAVGEGVHLAFTLAGMAMAVAVVPVTLTKGPGPSIAGETRMPVRTLMGRAPLAFFTCLLSGWITNSLFAMGPMAGQSLGLSRGLVGLFMSMLVVGGSVAQWPIGRLSDRMRRGWVIAGCGAFLALFTAALSFFWQPHQAVAAAAIGMGAFAFVLYPLAISDANDLLSSEEILGASGGLVLAYSVGAVVGPIATSLVMEA